MRNSGGVSAASSAKDIGHVSNQDGPGINTYSSQQKMKSKRYKMPTCLTGLHPSFLPPPVVYADLVQMQMTQKGTQMHLALHNGDASKRTVMMYLFIQQFTVYSHSRYLGIKLESSFSSNQ